MKVVILQSCSGLDFSYLPTEVVEVSAERGADLIKHNLAAALAPEPKAETAQVKTFKAETTRKTR